MTCGSRPAFALLCRTKGFKAVAPWLLLAATIPSVSQAAPPAAVYPLQAHAGTMGSATSQHGLNRTIGPADRVVAAGGHFYRVGADGRVGTPDDSRVRLYGANLTYSANFPAPDVARALARRIRSLGFNAVRLHHLDTAPDAKPDGPNSILTQGPYPTFNARNVERLRQFIKALKEEGIYTNLNVFVGYRFRPTVDRVPPMPGSDGPLQQGSAVGVYHPQLVALQHQYAKELIRQLDLRHEPALAMVEIRNESSLANAWQSWDGRLWGETIQGAYRDELQRQWNDWLTRKYGSLAKACETWTTCTGNGQQALVDPADADAARAGHRGAIGSTLERVKGAVENLTGLGRDKDGTPPSTGPHRRLYDFGQFVIDTDRRYLDDFRQLIRTAVGFDVPVTGTQMAFGGAMNLLSHASMDYVDDHFYIDHYQFPTGGWDYYDWRIRDSSVLTTDMFTLTGLARYRDMRKPYVVSEYNQAFPNRRGSEIMPTVAAFAAVQDWDGLFFFDLVDGDNWTIAPAGFRLNGDWAKLALVGQSAKLFRNALVRPATASLSFPLGSGTVGEIAAMRRRERRGLPDAPPTGWELDKAFNLRMGIVQDGAAPASNGTAAPAAGNAATEVRYQKDDGQLHINVAQLAGVAGRMHPGQKIDLDRITVEILDPLRDHAALMVSALDEQPIEQSRRLLVSVPGSVYGSQPAATPPRPKRLVQYPATSDWWTLEPDARSKGKPSAPRDAIEPLWMDRVPVRISLRTAHGGAQVFPLAMDGSRQAALPPAAVARRGSRFEFTLQNEPNPLSPWYEIVFSP